MQHNLRKNAIWLFWLGQTTIVGENLNFRCFYENRNLINKAIEQTIYVRLETFYLAFCYKKMFVESVLNYICTLKI